MADPNYAQFVQLAQQGYDGQVDRARQQDQLAQQQAAGRAYATGDSTTAARILARTGDIAGARQLSIYQNQDADRTARITGATAQAAGDYAGAGQAYASVGDRASLEASQDQEAQQAKRQNDYIKAAVPHLKQAAAQGQWQDAVTAMEPALRKFGATDKDIDTYRQSNPDQVIGAFEAAPDYQIVKTDTGDTIAINKNDLTAKPVVISKGLGIRALGGGKFAVAPGYDYAGVDGDGSVAEAGDDASAPVAGGSPAVGGGGVSMGDRNNNPGNVLPSPTGTWQGQVGVDPKSGYAVFDTPANGARAADLNLKAYAGHGITTPAALVERWASTSPDNEKAAYAARVQAAAGPQFDLNDPAVRARILPAIAASEGTHLGGAPATPTGGYQAKGQGRIVSTKAADTPDAANAGSPTLNQNALLQAATQFNLTGAFPKGLPIGKGGNPDRTAIRNMAADLAAKDGKTGGDLAAAGASYGAVKMALGQTKKQRAAIEAFEGTAIANGDLALSLAPKGVGGTNVPVFNKWIQAGRQASGDVAVGNFDVALKTFADEYGKVMGGGTGAASSTDSARAEAHSRIYSALNLQQLQGRLGVMKQEMSNRLISLRAQEDRLTGEAAGHPEAPKAAQPVVRTNAAPQNVIRYDANGRRVKP